MLPLLQSFSFNLKKRCNWKKKTHEQPPKHADWTVQKQLHSPLIPNLEQE